MNKLYPIGSVHRSKRDNFWSQLPREQGKLDDGLGAARGLMNALLPSVAIWAVIIWMLYEFHRVVAQ